MTKVDLPLEIPATDLEIKRISHAVQVTNDSPIARIVKRNSSWTKIKRVMGWILVMLQTLRSWRAHRKNLLKEIEQKEGQASNTHHAKQETDVKMKELKSSAKDNQKKGFNLSVDQLRKAEEVVVKYVQQQHYSEETKDILSPGVKTVKTSSALYTLDPFIEDGIIRVGGRISRSAASYDTKHPIVLPQQSEVAIAVVMDIHKEVGHMGRNAVLAQLRKKYWIPKAGALIKRILSRCVVCRRYRVTACKQKMSDLPSERVVADKPPFAHTGMDYFGPIDIKRGRSVVKRYGVIFTCMNSRAIHLEVAHSLNTDSCVNAIRRFVARRGSVESIRSDNGTNLVGAERELREALQQLNQSIVHRNLQQQAISWEFNPPSASHFGGVWERLIRCVRKVLFSILHDQVIHLDDEGLMTVFCEVENILNSRPITTPPNSPDDFAVLTPNDILRLNATPVFPCGLFSKDDIYVRRRWRQVQYLANLFWSRWSSEYLTLLQQRQKWLKRQRNVQVNDIVLVMDHIKNAWTMAKVIGVTMDKKGFVRIVQLQTPTGKLTRPVHKLSLLLEADI